MMQFNSNVVPEALQKTLNLVAAQLTDRKNEVVGMLSNEQPAKSRQIDMTYSSCIWWEGCYYCQDDAGQWHRVKCFI